MLKKDKSINFKKVFEYHESENNTSKLYSSVKSQLGWNNNGPPQSLVIKGKISNSSREMAEAQMNHFQMKVDKLTSELPESMDSPTKKLEEALKDWGDHAKKRPKLSLSEVTLMETVELIKSLGNGKAFGHDHLDSLSIKLAASHLYKPIQFLINMSIRTSSFANRWKIGRLIPLFKGKKLDKTLTSSYRPISLLPVVSKVVERAVQKQVLNFMINTKQMNDNNNA